MEEMVQLGDGDCITKWHVLLCHYYQLETALLTVGSKKARHRICLFVCLFVRTSIKIISVSVCLAM